MCGDVLGEACAVALGASTCACSLGRWDAACEVLDMAAAQWRVMAPGTDVGSNCAVATLLVASVEARISGSAAAAAGPGAAVVADPYCDELLRSARSNVAADGGAPDGTAASLPAFAWSLAATSVAAVVAGIEAAAGQLALMRGDLPTARVGALVVCCVPVIRSGVSVVCGAALESCTASGHATSAAWGRLAKVYWSIGGACWTDTTLLQRLAPPPPTGLSMSMRECNGACAGGACSAALNAAKADASNAAAFLLLGRCVRTARRTACVTS